MGCLIFLAAMLSPRFALFLIWLFSDRFDVAFDTNIVPFVGFLVLPWTTLAWTVCYAPVRGVEGFGWFLVIFAFVVDLASWGSGYRARQERAAAY
jgi:hypothetical protein